MKADDLLHAIEQLAEHLAQPITQSEFDGGWSAGGKEYWRKIVLQWPETVRRGTRPLGAPLNGKHLDNSGGGTDGELANELERVAAAVHQHYMQRPLWRRLVGV